MEQKIMKALAKKIDDAFDKEYEELNEAGKEFSPQLDAKLLEAAKFYDKRYAVGQKKQKSRQILQKAAVFLLIFLSVNTLAIGTSHAYRQFVFQVFENDGKGGEIDEMAYAIEHNMTIAAETENAYKIISNIYDEDQFIGEIEINDNTNYELMEEIPQQNIAGIQSLDLSNFDINELIHYADLYVGVDCINSSGYNSSFWCK